MGTIRRSSIRSDRRRCSPGSTITRSGCRTGAADEVGVAPATGLLRIDINKNDVQVFLDGQAVVAGSMTPAGQLVGFETNLVKGANGMLFFTDFKITR